MSKERWSDPANVGQPDYRKVGWKAFAIMMLLVIAAMIRIAINEDWLGQFRSTTGY